MAVRIEPSSDVEFGTMGAAVTVTHVRVRPTAATSKTIVHALTSDLDVPNGGALQIPSSSFDVVLPSGQIGNTFMEWLIKEGWGDTTSFQVDCLTDSTTVVSVSGYSQQTVTAWTISTEAD